MRQAFGSWILALALAAAPGPVGMAARASEAENAPGRFDYYVMALSWSPNWCALEGDQRRAPQCDEDHGWLLHGLWPQFETGWPETCDTSEPSPSRQMTREMTDIMGSAGLAWHQWRKHGSCSGLAPEDYFRLSRVAYGRVVRPEVFRKLSNAVRLPASVVEEAFLKDNPQLTPDMLTVTCRDGYVQEVRICFTRGLEPRPCGPDARRDCRLNDALFTPLR